MNNIGQLPENTVHVWWAMLSECREEDFLSVLSAAEKKRALGFSYKNDRQRFIVGRGILRNILANYLQQAPQALQFAVNEYAKPYLLDAKVPLNFNLSHANNMLMVAVSLNHQLGIDVEWLRRKLVAARIVKRFFAAEEQAAWLALPVAEKAEAFFRCWTRKEAFVKASGRGLGFPLASFVVSMQQQQQQFLLHVPGCSDIYDQYSAFSFQPQPDYVAAAVIFGKIANCQQFFWKN